MLYPKYSVYYGIFGKKKAGFDADDLPLTQNATISNSVAKDSLAVRKRFKLGWRREEGNSTGRFTPCNTEKTKGLGCNFVGMLC